MSATLVIYVDFTDESDFDFYRTRFVGTVEDAVAEALDDTEAPYADGNIEVSWDVREES